ncbi:hypothetical protein WQ54_21740 [Bacillus sp. SA1-12]|nr:hypothetical protein WQ54_21740 [Bacillus sp. SA1-12]
MNIIDFLQETKKTTLLENHHLNLPDLSFFRKCNEQYQINRGVYNTIDNWFFEYGIIHVIHRRIYILAFLNYVSETKRDGSTISKYIRFGHGGLTSALNSFVTNYINGYKDMKNFFQLND